MIKNDKPLRPANALATIWSWIVAWPWAAAFVVACLSFAVLNNSRQRTLFGVNEESDFTGSFGPDAQRILAGEPLHLDFHPPGYSFVAVLGRLLTDSWLNGGLWISGISALVFLVASLVTFKRLAGTAAAWGILIACACSTAFLSAASTASNDILFAALVVLMLALVVQAMSAPDRLQLWLCAGVVAAFAFLTRTNGLVAAAVLVTPFLVPADQATRARNLGAVAAGFFLPLLLWVLYAKSTASPLMPSGTYLNLAVAAYGEGGEGWGEQVARLRPQFENTLDVLTHDPLRMISQIGGRLLSLPRRLVLSLTWPPIVFLAVPGVLLMLWRRRTPEFLFYLFIAASLTLLSGIIGFQPRYFLFLIPLLGAMAGVGFEFFLEGFAFNRPARIIVTSAALLVFAFVAWKAYSPVLSKLETDVQLELAEAIPAVLRNTEEHATIYARKPNLSFETGRSLRFLPNVSTVALLHRDFCTNLEAGVPAYLYEGTAERRYRKGLNKDLAAAGRLPWLELIAKGSKTEWTLYRIRLYEPGYPQDPQCPAALTSR